MFSNQSVSVQPSAPPTETGGDAGVGDRLGRSSRKSFQVFGSLDARVLEGRGVVPDQGLVGGLEVDAVLLAVDRAEVLPALASSSCRAGPWRLGADAA